MSLKLNCIVQGFEERTNSLLIFNSPSAFFFTFPNRQSWYVTDECTCPDISRACLMERPSVT